VIEPADLGLAANIGDAGLEGGATAAGTRTRIVLGDDISLEEIEREHIAKVVSRAASFDAAARVLGIDVTTLQRKRKRYGLA
jgi:NtrC-family two-component system response regulator AlgB